VIGQVAQRLAPGGLLFLGASETVWQIQNDLDAVDLGACFGYRPRTEGEKEAPPARAGSGAARKTRDAEARPARTPARAGDATRSATDRDGEPSREKADTTRRTARDTTRDGERGRVTDEAPRSAASAHSAPDFPGAAAARSRPAGPSPGSPSAVIPSDSGRGTARRSPPSRPIAEKPRREASAEPAPAPSPAGGVQEKLLHAARLLAGNEVAESERLLGEALAADPSEPAAHALEGFLHDLVGRADEALAAYRAALYLEPELYQARQLLADCLLRRGHRDQAEHQYREVLATLVNGRERTLTALEDLPFPDPGRARRRCRQVLGRG
jgi:chemotaxis protein methyltransferase CheR